MKLLKGSRAIVLDSPLAPGELVGQCVTIVDSILADKIYWCRDKCGRRIWLKERSIESVKIHKRKERIRHKIEKLQAKLRSIK